MPKKNSLLLLFLVVSVGFAGDRWYPIRFEYSQGSLSAAGLSSGIWWSPHEDGIPVDAYGPTLGVMAYKSGTNYLPGFQFGVEANAVFVCARMQCVFYRAENNSTVALLNPQAGLTWLSIANVYVGYNKVLAAPAQTAVDEVNVAFCLNLPSYFFNSIQRRPGIARK